MAFGVFEFAVSLGITLGPALGAALVSQFGMRPLIYSTAGTALLCAALWTVGLHETSHQPSPIELASLKQLLEPRLLRCLLAATLLDGEQKAATSHRSPRSLVRSVLRARSGDLRPSRRVTEDAPRG